MISNFRISFILLLVVITPWSQVIAQDAHYWTHQYGTRSILLGGTVIGTCIDLSNTYYNPGGMALMENPTIIMSTNIFDYTSLKFIDGAGEGLDFSSLTFSSAPDLIAGMISIDELGDNKLAYSFFTRHRFYLRVNQRQNGLRDVIAGSPGMENYLGEVILDWEMNEDWTGLTWSYKIHKTVGVGITQYLAIRGQHNRSQVISQALIEDGVAVTTDIVEYDFINYRTLTKLGLMWDYHPFTIGFSITTPGINIYGTGSTIINSTITGQDLDGDGNPDKWMASSFEYGLSAKYNSSWAVGMGLSYRFKRGSIYGSAEWYDAVDEFTIMDTKDLEVQSTGGTIPHKVTQQFGQVLNYGVGIEYVLNKYFSYSGSFITDFSAIVPETNLHLAMINWDIYHFMTGGTVKIQSFDFTLGFGYAFGKGKKKQPINFTNIHENNALIGVRSEEEVIFNRLKLTFAFSILF